MICLPHATLSDLNSNLFLDLEICPVPAHCPNGIEYNLVFLLFWIRTNRVSSTNFHFIFVLKFYTKGLLNWRFQSTIAINYKCIIFDSHRMLSLFSYLSPIIMIIIMNIWCNRIEYIVVYCIKLDEFEHGKFWLTFIEMSSVSNREHSNGIWPKFFMNFFLFSFLFFFFSLVFITKIRFYLISIVVLVRNRDCDNEKPAKGWMTKFNEILS